MCLGWPGSGKGVAGRSCQHLLIREQKKWTNMFPDLFPKGAFAHLQKICNSAYFKCACSASSPGGDQQGKSSGTSIQKKFGAVTNDSINFLGESVQRIGTKFKSSLEVMMACSECPTVFVDAETLMSCGLLETLKFSVLELQEHLDTYNVKREAAEQWLENCKKTFGSGEVSHVPNTETQELELCRRLYKLHFQLLLLFQAYCKLINQVDTIKKETEVINMSEELCQLEACLKEAEASTDIGIEDCDFSDFYQASAEAAVHSLIEALRGKEFVSAIAQVKAFRIWG
ncbi:hypothetical protein AB205_0060800 [Aquarana catesbeiana]|uniref:Protein furry C-terminal domain-containing protein n=1 Tax=Aquarana catesbeiana TaxID=8400 RepID=A0A2G9S5I3_AQUCT|nr:hypothetical protein AB205_0060800 [Aquarana catesbeiana]